MTNRAVIRLGLGLGLGLGLVLGLAGCAAAATPAPEPLASNARRYEVAHPDRKTLSFGEFKAANVKRRWKSSLSISAGPVSANKGKQRFSFSLYRDQSQLKTDCIKTTSSTTVSVFVADATEQVRCDIVPAEGGAPWQVVLARGRDGGVQGKLVGGEMEIPIQGRRPNASNEPRAYVFGASSEIAAIDVGPKIEVVWLHTSLDASTSFAVAAASTALMLYDELP